MTGSDLGDSIVDPNSKKIQEAMKDVFNIPEIKKETKKRKAYKEITPENMSSLQSADIKDKNWEKISKQSTFNNNINNSSVIPLRGENETNYGGSLLDKSNRIMGEQIKPKDSIVSKNIAADKKREEKERREKDLRARQEWEKVVPAKKTSDVNVGAMGFTPNKSAYSLSELPKVNLKSVNKLEKKEAEGEKIGQEAFQIQKEYLEKKLDERTNVKSNWEDSASESLQASLNKKVESNVKDLEINTSFLPYTEKGSESEDSLLKSILHEKWGVPSKE